MADEGTVLMKTYISQMLVHSFWPFYKNVSASNTNSVDKFHTKVEVKCILRSVVDESTISFLHSVVGLYISTNEDVALSGNASPDVVKLILSVMEHKYFKKYPVIQLSGKWQYK